MTESISKEEKLSFTAAEAKSEMSKLVRFFRSREGDALGRDGDHDNLSPADTAIRAMRRLHRLELSVEAHKPDNCDCSFCTGAIP